MCVFFPFALLHLVSLRAKNRKSTSSHCSEWLDLQSILGGMDETCKSKRNGFGDLPYVLVSPVLVFGCLEMDSASHKRVLSY